MAPSSSSYLGQTWTDPGLGLSSTSSSQCIGSCGQRYLQDVIPVRPLLPAPSIAAPNVKIFAWPPALASRPNALLSPSPPGPGPQALRTAQRRDTICIDFSVTTPLESHEAMTPLALFKAILRGAKFSNLSQSSAQESSGLPFKPAVRREVL